MFLKISQNSLENNCTRAFFNKVAGCGLQFKKKNNLAQVLLWKFCEIFKTGFSMNTPVGCVCYSSEELWITDFVIKKVLKHLLGKILQNSLGNTLSTFLNKGSSASVSRWIFPQCFKTLQVTSSRSLLEFWKTIFNSERQFLIRSSPPEVRLGKGVLKICSKFTGQHSCRATLLKSHFGMGVLL